MEYGLCGTVVLEAIRRPIIDLPLSAGTCGEREGERRGRQGLGNTHIIIAALSQLVDFGERLSRWLRSRNCLIIRFLYEAFDSDLSTREGEGCSGWLRM